VCVCVGVYMCLFCNVWVRVCVCFVMCGLVYVFVFNVWACVYVCLVMCWCVYVFVLYCVGECMCGLFNVRVCMCFVL